VSTITTKDGSEGLPSSGGVTPQGLELRHLRYFVAVADAGNFTHAAERMFTAQPTLSQQIRRLEEIIGTPLLQRRREGLRLTTAGTVLLGASRHVLSLVDHGMSRTRQAAGVGRQRLRVVMPPSLPEALAVQTASLLHSAAEAGEVDVAWLERPLDAEFSLIQQRQADAGLGWLTTGPETLPAPLDVMSLGEFEPEVWIPATHPAACRGTISLGELAGMTVIHGPRRAEPGTYDAWTRVLRGVHPRFEFTDPPFRHSLLMTLAFAGTSDRPTAVLTGPASVRCRSVKKGTPCPPPNPPPSRQTRITTGIGTGNWCGPSRTLSSSRSASGRLTRHSGGPGPRLALLAMLDRAGTGDLDAADVTARRALTVAEEVGDAFATAHALTDLWLSHGVRRDHAAALDYVDRALRVLGDDAGYADLRSYALEVRIFTLQNLDRWPEAELTLYRSKISRPV